MQIGTYSFGIGDRFGKEGNAQLRAIQEINRMGFPVTPVWNKSNREHELVGTTQQSVRKEADEAVIANGWKDKYFVDADHITSENVNKFIEHSDFFTIDVAQFIGRPPEAKQKEDFIKRSADQKVPGYPDLNAVYDRKKFADQYLNAIHEVKRVYDQIRFAKPAGFITEISMDEVPGAQSAIDLYFILSELKYLGIEPHTIAPKFSGLFPKGVEYVGDLNEFENQFEADLRMIHLACKKLEICHPVRLSVHSGSDKFSLYPIIGKLFRRHEAGIHIKTAGTTWLEEVIGLARGGGDGLRIAKEIYRQGMIRYDEMAAPYSTVLHIDSRQLPPASEVLTWNSGHFANTLIHDQECRDYNPHFRQLIHISYKAAAELGGEFTDALDHYRDPIEDQVYNNLINRHLKRIFR